MDTDAFYDELGRRIRSARLEYGLTQAQLAERVSLTRTSLTNIERGKQKLLAHTLYEIATALEVEPAVLLPGLDLSSLSSQPKVSLAEQLESDMPAELSSVERDWIRAVVTKPRPRR